MPETDGAAATTTGAVEGTAGTDDAGVDGQHLFNPGSPTERRSQPDHTLGTLDLDGGRVVSAIHRL